MALNLDLERYDFDDLDDLAAGMQVTITTLSDGDPQRAALAFEVAKVRFRQYELGNNLESLDNAIGLLGPVIQEPPLPNAINIAKISLALGNFICVKNERMKELQFFQPWSSDDLERQVANMVNILAITPEDNPDFARFKIVLDEMMRTNEESRQTEGDLHDLLDNLDQLSDLLQRVIERGFGDDENIPPSPSQLQDGSKGPVTSLMDADFSDEERDILKVIVQGEELLKNNRKDGDPADLDLAIERCEEAMNRKPQSIVGRATGYLALTKCFAQRYQEKGENGDLEKAIYNGEEAKKAVPEDNSCREFRSIVLGDLGATQIILFDASSQKDFLDAAMVNHEEALKLAEDGERDILTQIYWLSSTLSARYRFLGNKEDLDMIEKILQRPEIPASDDTKMRGMLKHIHSSALAKRYEQTKDLQTLDLAIKKQTEALEDMPEDHYNRHRIMSGLAAMHGEKYTRLGANEHFQEALKLRQREIEAAPKNSTSHGLALIEKGNLLRQRYQTHRSEQLLAEIDAAITEGHALLEKANTVGSEAMRLAFKGRALLRFEQWKALRFGGSRNPFTERHIFDHAIKDLKASVLSQPESSSTWIGDALLIASLLAAKAYALASEGEPFLARETIEKAKKWFSKVLEHPAATPLVQIRAVHNVLIYFTSSDPSMLHWKDQAANIALRQLPHACNRELNRESQQEIMKAVSGVASSICSLSIRRGMFEDAVQRIEYGRGLILGHLIDRKDNIDDLKKTHKDLAQRYEHLRELSFKQLQATPLSQEWETMRNAQTNARDDLKVCEDEIRQLPGFENFQKPVPVKELQAQAKDGPIVIVNVSNIGSDAIIMTESKLTAIPLSDMKKNIPPLLHETFEKLRSSDLRLLLGHDLFEYSQDAELLSHDTELLRRDAEPLSHDAKLLSRDAELISRDTSRSRLLTWLWKTCVAPVVVKLRELGELTGTTNGDPPRVWWIGTGAAASLPFHAAGDINEMSNANLGPHDLEKQLLSCMDWMTPSYAASIKSLQYAKSRAANLVLEEEPAILVIAMPTTPGHSSLLGVETEKKAIQEANIGFRVTSLMHPSSEEVLAKLHSSSIAHFACHGMSHPTDLDASHILIQKKGSNDRPELDRLTVGEILDITTHSESGSWLVYLSACATAQVKHQKLGDENVHLASALQIAGFSHAVGSLWSANDDACAEVARYFYEELSKYRVEDRKLAVAGALRRAIMKVRSECVDNPDYWAPFVHFGA